jgi:hypothetical protein
MKYHEVDAKQKYSIQYINLSVGVDKNCNVLRKTLKNIERSTKRANPKSRIPAGTWNDLQKKFSPGEKKLGTRVLKDTSRYTKGGVQMQLYFSH